jgi:hypothetical protein
MGLIEKNFKQEKATPAPISKLTISEYEFLFALIKNSSFKGEQLELLYNLTVKLQEEYFALKPKE